MNHELAKTLTTALVQFIDRERPKGTMDCSNSECVSLEKAFTEENFDSVETLIKKKLSRLTEFEDKLVSFALQCGGQWDTAIERHSDCPKPIYEAWKRSLLQDGQKNHLTVEDIKTILDISFWNDDPQKILEEYNRICDTSKVTRR